MLIELGLMGAPSFAKTLYDAYKSTNMDERAMQKYSQAFEKEQDAKLIVKRKAEYTDKRLANVAKKKRFVIQNTFPQFVSVYDKIQKIEIDQKNVSNEIIAYNSNDQFVVKDLAISAKKEFTDKELVCGMIFGGIGNLMVKESERNLSAANSQMRAANVAYSQAQSIAEVYDAIVGRADRIAKLIVAMNILFVRSINETEHTIDRNGYNVRNYNDYDKGILMTCVNIAKAMADILNIPVVESDGKISEKAVEMIENGEQYLDKMNALLQS